MEPPPLPQSIQDQTIKKKLSEKPTLKRNQACLTCRKRKLRCDATRPTCSTCMKSWNHTISHLKSGKEAPPRPICEYEGEEQDIQPAQQSSSSSSSASSSFSNAAVRPGQQQPAQPPFPLPSHQYHPQQQLQQHHQTAYNGSFRSDPYPSQAQPSFFPSSSDPSLPFRNAPPSHPPGPSSHAEEAHVLRSRVKELESLLNQTATALMGGSGATQPPPQHQSMQQEHQQLSSSRRFSPPEEVRRGGSNDHPERHPPYSSFANHLSEIGPPPSSSHWQDRGRDAQISTQQHHQNPHSFASSNGSSQPHPRAPPEFDTWALYQQTRQPSSSSSSSCSSQAPLPPPPTSVQLSSSSSSAFVDQPNRSTPSFFHPSGGRYPPSSPSIHCLLNPVPASSSDPQPPSLLAPSASQAFPQSSNLSPWTSNLSSLSSSSTSAQREVEGSERGESLSSSGGINVGYWPRPDTVGGTGPAAPASRFVTSPEEQTSQLPRVVDAEMGETCEAEAEGDGMEDLSALLGTEGNDKFLLDLLWPGWPPHLPSPGLMDHIVDVFFSSMSFVSAPFNQARLKARLALPPTHSNFPHPAVLHGLCAVTARFLGTPNLFIKPAGEEGNRMMPMRKPQQRNTLSDGAQRPTWDGFGPRPAWVSEEDGVEGDFGEIHNQWAKLYIFESMPYAADWLSITQAYVLLAHFAFLHARWSEGWVIFGQAERMFSPLGLYHEKLPGSKASNRETFKRELLEAPEDDTARVEQQNLLWFMVSMDSSASMSTGWKPCFSIDNITQSLPVGIASHPSNITILPCSIQHVDDPEVFASHPGPHANSYTYFVKACLIGRRVSDFTRKVAIMRTNDDPRAIRDAREMSEFKEIDNHLASFATSISHKDPITFGVALSGEAVDRDLLAAQSSVNVAVLLLHDRYVDVYNPQDPSNQRMKTAIRSLLRMIYSLSATNFDLSHLHPSVLFCWFTGSRILIRHLEVAIQQRDIPLQASLRGEIHVFRTALEQIGQRLPLGVRQVKMVDHLLHGVPLGANNFCTSNMVEASRSQLQPPQRRETTGTTATTGSTPSEQSSSPSNGRTKPITPPDTVSVGQKALPGWETISLSDGATGWGPEPKPGGSLWRWDQDMTGRGGSSGFGFSDGAARTVLFGEEEEEVHEEEERGKKRKLG